MNADPFDIIAGETIAKTFIERLRAECLPADALLDLLKSPVLRDQPGYLQGAARALQKALERR